MNTVFSRQAYATRQDISRQGRALQNINNRVVGVISKSLLLQGRKRWIMFVYLLILFLFCLGRIPGINNLISRINTRRKRDTLIMAAVISTCIILILLYWLRT